MIPAMGAFRHHGFGIGALLPATFLLSVLLAACMPSPPSSEEPELLVFAAASLSDVLIEVGEAFEASGGASVAFHFAASSTLARQIAAGAPADLFLSAGPEPVELLEERGAVVPGSVRPLLGNRLVVVVPAEGGLTVTAPADLLAVERLALADPEAGVPAGVYARQWLEREGLWAALRPRLVPALDVRAALAAVAAGNVDAGVVYATDAAASGRVRVAYRVPPERAPRIVYELAEVAGGDRPEPPGRQAFAAYLAGADTAAVFTRHGFEVLPRGEEGGEAGGEAGGGGAP
jgi:molybdate transport system substrate-binding protein